jgi:hypothetical protein
MNKADAVNLLWTSGWDSTFRLLNLVFTQGRKVQPYYALGRKRISAKIELETMEKIKKAIERKFPLVRALIAETKVFNINDIPAYPDITDSLNRLKSIAFIGSQYDFLARTARYYNLTNLELSVHVDDKLYEHLKANVQEVDGVYRLVDNLPNPDLEALRAFCFPILMMTKLDMEKIARHEGYADILELSWFCYHPDSKGRPCGTCNPCRYTIEEGMGRRIPWQGHVRKTLKDLTAPSKKLLRRLKRNLLGG